MNLRKQLIELEGWRHAAYPDPLTHGDPWTIGCGCAKPGIKEGDLWTDAQISAQLDHDIAEKTAQCRANFPWFDSLNEPRQAVVIGMCFQLGMAGLLKFKNTLAAMRDERWANAAEGMRRSLWANQTPRRANMLAHQMETGDWA